MVEKKTKKKAEAKEAPKTPKKVEKKAPELKNEETKKPVREDDDRLERADRDRDFDLGASKNLFGKIFLALLVILLAIFFGKTAIWEYYYYNEKEGSERTPAVNVEADDPEELDETPVTEEQRAEYTVPGNYPRYLTIEKLGIYNARVLSMGLTVTGELDTPNNIFDVGWYNQSGKPGGGGTLVIDGHNGGPNVVGVFKYLNELYADDLIVVERGDGYVYTYKVVENKEVPIDESDDYMHTALTSPVPGEESITLISCVGEWSSLRQTYLSRQFVRAVLIEEKAPSSEE